MRGGVKSIVVFVPTMTWARTIVERLSKQLPGEYFGGSNRFNSNSGLVGVTFIVGSCTDCIRGLRCDAAIVPDSMDKHVLSYLSFSVRCDIRVAAYLDDVVGIIVGIHDDVQNSIHTKVAEMRHQKLLGTVGRVMEYLGIDIGKLEGDNGSLYDTIVGQIETIKDGGLR